MYLRQMAADKIVNRANKRLASLQERKFNASEMNEVAAAVVDNKLSRLDIIQRRSIKLQRIADTHYSCEAL